MNGETLKIKIMPETKTVREILQDRIDSESKILDDNNSALAKLTAAESGLYNIYAEREILDMKATVKNRTEYINDRKTELMLLDAHSAPRTLVEIDV